MFGNISIPCLQPVLVWQTPGFTVLEVFIFHLKVWRIDLQDIYLFAHLQPLPPPSQENNPCFKPETLQNLLPLNIAAGSKSTSTLRRVGVFHQTSSPHKPAVLKYSASHPDSVTRKQSPRQYVRTGQLLVTFASRFFYPNVILVFQFWRYDTRGPEIAIFLSISLYIPVFHPMNNI